MDERKKTKAERHAEWLAGRRELEGILPRLEERIRVVAESDDARRRRLPLTFGLLGRS